MLVSEALGVHERAHSAQRRTRSRTKRAKHLPPQARRARQFPLRAPLAFRLSSAHLRCVTPSVTLRIFPTHGQRSAERDLPRRAPLRRPDEPTETVARRRNRGANPLRPLRKPDFSSEPRVLMHKRAASLGRTPFGARADRHADSIAGPDRQEMGEDAARRLGRIIGLARPNIGAPLEGEGRSAADALIN